MTIAESILLATLRDKGGPMPCAQAQFVHNGNLVNWHCGCHGWHFKVGG